MRDYVLANTTKRAPAVYLVESGIDLDEYRPSPRQDAEPGALVIGYVGRMSPEKDPLAFVELAERLHARLPQLRFRMFGEGWMAKQVCDRIAAGPAAASIAFEGYAVAARDAYHAIDVLVVPSKLDGRPNSVMEANACGVPVIGAPVGGIPELIEEGRNGHVISPQDHAALAGVVSGWLADPGAFAELRRLSRETAERRFDRRRMMDEYAAVFAGTAPAEASACGARSQQEAGPSASFVCNLCGATAHDRRMRRGDGKAVLFCAECGFGVIEDPPASTEAFYADGYYGGEAADGSGYHDYAFTAEHTHLWSRLLVETLKPAGGRILDIGCADGFLLHRLRGPYERFGIEVNAAAAAVAAGRGVQILASDIADPALASAGRFDVVTAIATFEHVLDFRQAVATALDLLTRDGVLIFEVPLMSYRSDNKDWLNGSYEHIFYPTESGLERLFASFPGIRFAGFETEITGFSASYIGVAARDPSAFAEADRLLDAMSQETLTGLGPAERRLNLAYHVVHGFRPTPERIAALPELLEVAATPNLLKRLTQLWHDESLLVARP
jgi:SAM-dependent methyltransferase